MDRTACDNNLKTITLRVIGSLYEVREKAKIRNPYNQIPHLAKDIISESDKNTKKISHTREPRGQPFPSR